MKTLKQLYYFNTIDSTNLEARRMLKNTSSPFVVVAGEQTAGRGRCGKSFFSPMNSGLYMTIALPCGNIPQGVVTLTCRVGIAVSKAIDSIFGCHTGIKWVNDIFLSGRKICGILCEAISDDTGTPTHILIGIGINISTAEFPGDIKDTAGSILGLAKSAASFSLMDSPQSAASFSLMDSPQSAASNSFTGISEEKIKDISSEIYRTVIDHLDPSYDPIDDYKKRSVVLGHDITFTENGIAHAARAIDIDHEGGLVVKLADTNEVKTLSSGEISLRLSH
ncbi:MAG: biotin--[acetyl-CoA-carboxylase] ligase [Lachnospiraceae bacterium]|nr:biotin--[acetyl-CoA-carboxylase] ligase [Lachnospiraceae bacterium]